MRAPVTSSALYILWIRRHQAVAAPVRERLVANLFTGLLRSVTCDSHFGL
jgi:hypothetical protein